MEKDIVLKIMKNEKKVELKLENENQKDKNEILINNVSSLNKFLENEKDY